MQTSYQPGALAHLCHSPVIDANGGYTTDVTSATTDQRFKNAGAVLPDSIKVKLYRDASATQNLNNSAHLCFHADAEEFVLQEIDDGLQKGYGGLNGGGWKCWI
jgi:hypothetical protein